MTLLGMMIDWEMGDTGTRGKREEEKLVLHGGGVVIGVWRDGGLEHGMDVHIILGVFLVL
jgi:hypothetical protein